MEELCTSSVQSCARAQGLQPADQLTFPKHQRAFLQYVELAAGQRELHIHYRDLEIVFDEPELFGFGEALLEQSSFAAGSALDWAPDAGWPRVKELLEQLIESGVLLRGQ